MKILLRFIITIYFSFILTINLAFAKNYCNVENSKYTIIYLHINDLNEGQKIRIKNDIRNLFEEKLKFGDMVNFFIFDGSGEKKIISECKPGCPPAKLTDILTGGDCNIPVAKRDTNNFMRTFNKF